MRPTPIHKWELPGVPSGFEVFVKRDDMTGSTLGGNKVCWKVVLKNHMPLIMFCGLLDTEIGIPFGRRCSAGL